MSEKLYITWEDFHQHVKKLCKKIKASGSYNKIVAVSRGGLIPAGIIAYELDIKNNETINFSSYDDSQHQLSDEKIKISANIGIVDEKTLIVDDLSDTGRTFKILRQIYPSATYVTVYAKEQGASQVDIHALDLPNQWVVFPWDI